MEVRLELSSGERKKHFWKWCRSGDLQIFFFAVSKDFQDLCLRVKVAFMRDPFFHTETDFMASASLAGSCVLEIFLVAHVLSSLK